MAQAKGPGRRAWVAAGVCLALLAGCKSSPTTAVIKDDTNVRTSEARKLAAQAQSEARAGHTDKAIELYQKSLEQSRDLFFVWNNLGLLLIEKQNYTDAAEMFKSAADLAPEDPRPFYNIGLIYQKAVYDEKALDYFVKSLERDSKYLPSLRGAIISGKRLDVTDEPALTRVRTALLIENDAQWRRIFETEELRLEGTMSRAKHGIGTKSEHHSPDLPPAVQPPADGTPPPAPPPKGGGESSPSGD